MNKNAFRFSMAPLALAACLVSGTATAATCSPDSNGNLVISAGADCSAYLLNNPSASAGAIENSGLIQEGGGADNYAIRIESGTLGSLVNNATGVISAPDDAVNLGAVHIRAGAAANFIVNAGTILGQGGVGWADGIMVQGTVGSIVNHGLIRGDFDGVDIIDGSVGVISNTGTISGTGNGLGLARASLDQLDNFGTISSPLVAGSQTWGVWLYGNGTRIGMIRNFAGGSIRADEALIVSSFGGGATIGQLENEGALTGASYGLRVYDPTDRVGVVTNLGSITGGLRDINNLGTIGTLTNAQGGNAASASTTALTLEGNLPQNYNAVLASATRYGQLAVTSGAGNMSFGISKLSTPGARSFGTYNAVFSGVSSAALGIAGSSLMGAKSNGYTYNLVETAPASSIWNLTILGWLAPADDTQAALQNTARELRGVFGAQGASALAGLGIDCSLFDKNGVCLGVGGRYTRVNAADASAGGAVLSAAWQLSPGLRVGAWMDQGLAGQSSPTLKLGNETPMLGLFGAWSPGAGGLGLELKWGATYGERSLSVTRRVVGLSEAGSGSTRLSTAAAFATVGYGLPLATGWTATPYAGLRQLQIKAGGYREVGNINVLSPLSVAELSQETETALVGLRMFGHLTPAVGIFGSVELEQDYTSASSQLAARGVDGLTDVAISTESNRSRAAASLGVYYTLGAQQRISVSLSHRSDPFAAASSLSANLNYSTSY